MIPALPSRRPSSSPARLSACLLIAMACSGLLVREICAAPPELRDFSPRGLQSGATTRLVVQGEHLDERTRLVLPTTPAAEVRLVSAAGNQLELEITVAAEVQADRYPLRLANDQGISTALLLAIDDLPQESMGKETVTLPVALHGALAGDQVLRSRFAGRKGQSLVVDVEGKRLGSALRPVLQLMGPDGRLVAAARPQIQLQGDARLAVTLPADGDYRLEMHDVVYQGPGPGHFRLKIGELHYADRVYPSVSRRAPLATLEYLGSNLQQPAVPSPFTDAARLRSQPVPWPAGVDRHDIGPRPRVALSEFGAGEWTEEQWKQREQSAPTLAAPLAISGRIATPTERDTFTIEVHPESRLRVDLQASRIGSPLDAVLEVFAGPAEANGQPTGAALGRADDQPGSADPLLDLQIPADVRQLTLRVSSLTRDGSSAHDYRLTVQSIDALPPLLSTEASRVIVPAGGHFVLPVRVQHPANPRALQLELDAPPELLQIGPATIDAGEDLTLVSFHAASGSQAAFTARLLARAADGSPAMAGALSVPLPPGAPARSDLRYDLGVAITPAAPLAVRFAPFLPTHWDRGSRQTLGVQLLRSPGGHAGPVRLSLLSSQVAPTKQENNQTVPDLPRTWRLLENPVVTAGASDAAVTLVTPVDLPMRHWNLAVQADLLSDDGQTVLATVHSPVLRRATRDPLELLCSPPAKVTVRAGDEQAVVLEGQVRRVLLPDTPVIVQLVGLPAGMPELQTLVPAGESTWKLPVRLPREVTAQEIKDVRLVARFQQPDESLADARGNSSPFTLEVTAATP